MTVTIYPWCSQCHEIAAEKPGAWCDRCRARLDAEFEPIQWGDPVRATWWARMRARWAW